MSLQDERQRRLEGCDLQVQLAYLFIIAMHRSRSYVLPIKTQTEQAKSFVVQRSTEDSGQDGSRVPGSVHRGQTGNGDRVQPWEDISREEFIEKHADETVPEPSDRFRILHALPMESLKCLDCGKIAPVDGLDVPHGDWAHDAADAVAK